MSVPGGLARVKGGVVVVVVLGEAIVVFVAAGEVMDSRVRGYGCLCDEGRAAWRGTYMSVLVARPRAVSEAMDQ